MKRLKGLLLVGSKRSLLAKYIGASPQELTNWINGHRMPSGEVTLLMLEWVTAEEAKKNETVAVLVTPPRRKTRQPQHLNEKVKRVRKKY